jgi:hypothetical protein
MLVQGALLVGDDCHWYVIPAAAVVPFRLSVTAVEAVGTDVAVTLAVPAVGVPVQGFAPVPFTLTVTAVGRPPPVIDIVPV